MENKVHEYIVMIGNPGVGKKIKHKNNFSF